MICPQPHSLKLKCRALSQAVGHSDPNLLHLPLARLQPREASPKLSDRLWLPLQAHVGEGTTRLQRGRQQSGDLHQSSPVPVLGTEWSVAKWFPLTHPRSPHAQGQSLGAL